MTAANWSELAGILITLLTSLAAHYRIGAGKKTPPKS